MQIYDLRTDEHGRELTRHGSADFPCAFYDEKFSEFINGEVPWHWHEELELVYVVEGCTRIESIHESIPVNQGEAVFVNSECLHKLINGGESDCRILNFVFAPFFLSGTRHSKVYERLIVPLITNADLTLYKFMPDVEWQLNVIDELKRAFMACCVDDEMSEISTQIHLLEVWKLFYLGSKDVLNSSKKPQLSEKRLHDALSYIHSHYSERISVLDISRSVHMSESECYRLFKSSLKCTPNNYLNDYRLQKAASLLVETALPVTEIALNVGFNHGSYFTKRFVKSFGKTPKQFRRQRHG